MKIVINTCFGGFSLSKKAQEFLGVETPYPDIERNNSKLIEVVEQLGVEANGMCTSLAVVEIPDSTKWHIHEYDGNETIHENHRSWSELGEHKDC